MLRLRGVSKSFSQRGRPTEEVLAGIDFTLGRGEFASIIGPSGCGKSTLLNLISGTDSDYDGEIAFSDSDGSRLGLIGYMQQKDLLLPWRTVLDNAGLALELRGNSRKRARDAARERLGRFGLAAYADHYPAQLSGGMRQRVALLRATLGDATLLLLDEPFGALDALTRADMHDWLIGLLAGSGQSVVLVTHDVDEAILLSDRICIMRPGPGRIDGCFEVNIGDRRSPDVLTSSQFIALKSEVLANLRGSKGFRRVA